MPAIATATRFFQPGLVAFVFLPAIAATTRIPTAPELAAGTTLTNEIDDIAGWTVSTAFIETKDASTPVRPQLAGAVTFEGSSITFNASQTGTDARGVFTRGQTGFILIADAGLGTGKKGDVFPVVVGAIAKLRNLDNANFKIRVDFGITGVPAEDIALP
jgi:hypothetical protein